MLTSREAELLKHIIEEHITTGQPVGSSVLVKKYDLHISSATVRNIMAHLAELGFLDQPHTSAGRVPQTLAYRYYVEQYLENKRASRKVIRVLDPERGKALEKKEYMQNLVGQLAAFTSQVALAKYMNQLFISGWSNAVQLVDNTELYRLFSFLEDHERLMDLISQLTETDDIRFFIGNENPYCELHECTLALIQQPFGEGSVTVGIMGPLRMDYSRIISTLRSLHEIFSNRGD